MENPRYDFRHVTVKKFEIPRAHATVFSMEPRGFRYWGTNGGFTGTKEAEIFYRCNRGRRATWISKPRRPGGSVLQIPVCFAAIWQTRSICWNGPWPSWSSIAGLDNSRNWNRGNLPSLRITAASMEKARLTAILAHVNCIILVNPLSHSMIDSISDSKEKADVFLFLFSLFSFFFFHNIFFFSTHWQDTNSNSIKIKQ